MSPEVGTLPGRRDAASGAALPPLHPGPFRPRAGVLTARALDAAALYDPRAERYVTLNPVATRIWELLDHGDSMPAITDRLCAEVDAPRERVAHDVASQIAVLLQNGLIEAGLGPAPRRVADRIAHEGGVKGRRARAREAPPQTFPHVPSVLQCLLTLARVKWLLRTRRLEGTLAWIHDAVGSIPASESALLEEVQALEYAVAMAAAFYPGRAKCLEQSLALYYLAHQQGVWVRYCQGIQLYPFEAHAWIEYQGRVVNDVAEHVKHFTKFPDQLP